MPGVSTYSAVQICGATSLCGRKSLGRPPGQISLLSIAAPRPLHAARQCSQPRIFHVRLEKYTLCVLLREPTERNYWSMRVCSYVNPAEPDDTQDGIVKA